MQLWPAIGTEICAVHRDRAACRTTLGQREVKRGLDDLAQQQHRPLVCEVAILHKAEMELPGQPPEIFDRCRRHALRERAAQRKGERFLWDYVANELTERLALVTRDFNNALIIGPIAGFARAIMGGRKCALYFACSSANEAEGAVEAEEDRLPFDPQSFDLVIAAGTLDSVNDLPGALVQIRRILKPDGLFLGHMFGAGSLSMLKSLMMEADGDAAKAHIHPQIDLRSAADLLSRAGFALPVADSDVVPVRYGDWRTIVRDVRDAGVGNALAGPRAYVGKEWPKRLDAAWQRQSDDNGKLAEQFAHIFLSGWTPAPNQPKPAARGSGTVSLTSVFPSA